jgi:hypothetical protein
MYCVLLVVVLVVVTVELLAQTAQVAVVVVDFYIQPRNRYLVLMQS